MSYKQACTIQARRYRALAHEALDAGNAGQARNFRDAAEYLSPGTQTSVDARLGINTVSKCESCGNVEATVEHEGYQLCWGCYRWNIERTQS
jgi:hypothetical protein